MSELILGIGLLGHDSSATLLNTEGKILYCLTEERFSNIKHDGNFPTASLAYINERIQQHNLGTIRHIGLNNDPILFTEQKLCHYIRAKLPAPMASSINKAILSVLPHTQLCRQGAYPMTYFAELINRAAVPISFQPELLRRIQWCMNRTLFLRGFIDYLGHKYPDSTVTGVPHHLCHAASAFYASGFDKAAILTIDGHGEYDTISLAQGTASGIQSISATGWPHSLGMLYNAFTTFLGFAGLGDEYKVMGMAAYGRPTYKALFDQLGHVDEAGNLVLHFADLLQLSETPGCPGEYWPTLSQKFQDLLGGARKKDQDFEPRHYEIASSLQNFVEEMGVQIACRLRKAMPDTDAICIAGGVGLNGLMNQRIRTEAGFKKVFIQPASTDDGTSLGAALQLLADNGGTMPTQRLRSMFLGLDYPPDLAEQTVRAMDITFTRPDNISAAIAALLAKGHIVARYEGRSEFGPRALGHRSILASPLTAEMKDTLNARIKHREMFRPFAPACLAEHVSTYFEADEDAEYMLLICPVRPEKRALIPAVVHLDGTARVQAVRQDANPSMHKIIQAFMDITNVPIIINTSFNVNGEAIVETPRDAIECFLYTDIDYLAIEDMLIAKTDNTSKSLHLSNHDFLARRKNRYLTQHWSHELYRTPTAGTYGVTATDIQHDEARQHEEACHSLIRRAIDGLLSRVCIAGAGPYGTMILKHANQQGLYIAGFTDSTPEKIGTFHEGLPIMSVETALQEGYRCFLIGSHLHAATIRSSIMMQANKLGLAPRIMAVENIGLVSLDPL